MKFLRNQAKSAYGFVNWILGHANIQLVRKIELADFHIYKYESYEEYKEAQTYHNKRKITSTWADEATLSTIANMLLSKNQAVTGLCHGTRNGFEQNFFNYNYNNFNVIGTDISDSATDFDNSIQWDFHDEKEEWENNFDFVYSNSLDQSWKPKLAVSTWIKQLKPTGLLFIEHTKYHGPEYAGAMDPFGAKPTALPYILSDWFGHRISISIKRGVKSNSGHEVWLFIIRRNTT